MKSLRREPGMVVLVVVLIVAVPARVAAAVDTVTYGLVSWNPLHWVVRVGLAKGQFERHGVKLDIPIRGSSGGTAIASSTAASIGTVLVMSTPFSRRLALI